MPNIDIPTEKLPKREVSLIKGRGIKWEKEKLIHKDVVNELWKIQVEDRPLEMCKDVPFDLELAKSITQLRRLNKKGILQSTHQVDLMKDDRMSVEVAKGSDVHVEPKGVDMLM
jgi:hypothetical protein